MDDAREICNIVPFPGFSSSVSGGRGNDGPFLMAEHSLLSSKITLLLNELITRYHYVTFFFFIVIIFIKLAELPFRFFYNVIECKQIDVIFAF